jgi:hypothetical protein
MGLRDHLKPLSLITIFLASCALAFSIVAYPATWWKVTLSIDASSLPSFVSSLVEGAEISGDFRFTNVYLTTNTPTEASTTVDYDNVPALDQSGFQTMQNIQKALIAMSGSLLLAGAVSLVVPALATRTAGLLVLLVISLAGLSLSVSNLSLETRVPQDVADSYSDLVSDIITFPNFTCDSNYISWGGLDFVGEVISCGNDIWQKNTFVYTYTNSSNTTTNDVSSRALDISSAILVRDTAAGAGWFWTFGAGIAFFIVVLSITTTFLARCWAARKERAHLASENDSEENRSDVELNPQNQGEEIIAPKAEPKQEPVLTDVTA